MRIVPLYYGLGVVTMCLMNVYECVNSCSMNDIRMDTELEFALCIIESVKEAIFMDGFAKELMWVSEAGKIEVPFFQRPYVWDEENFESLIESFLDSPGNTMPFFGSIILKELQENGQSFDPKQYLVIDGQQRITTFNILVRVLLDIHYSVGLGITSRDEVKMLDFIYRTDSDEEGNESYSLKLWPSNADKARFDMIMNPQIDRKAVISLLADAPLDEAYKFFYNYFVDIENKDIPKAICKKLTNINCKSLIFIILGQKDDEQKIFDSVNSMGKSLSNSDIIKNYLYQKMKEKAGSDQVKIDNVMKHYRETWDSVFYKNEATKAFWYSQITVGRFLTDHLETYLKDFAIIKGIYTAKKTTGVFGLCKAYKEYIDRLCDKPDSLKCIMSFASEIKEYAQVYYDYKTEYRDVDCFKWSDYRTRLLLILDQLDTSTFNPYILKLLKENPDDIERKFFNLEKFLLMRFIYEGTAKNYNQCCEGLLNASDDLQYYDGYMKESPVDNSSYTTKFRKLTNDQGKLFMFLLEMLKRDGEEDQYSDLLKIKTYELEHVMPQKWASNLAWQTVDSYDENGEKIDKNDAEKFVENRDSAVKSIGNFALLRSKLNKSISNADFYTKVNGKIEKSGAKKDGMKKYAAAMFYTKAIIDLCDEGKSWDERQIYSNEKSYFDLLNGFYNFC